MTLKQLHYVLEIADCGSITEAAKRLYISQPSLSSAVMELEEELHLSIFRRSPRGVTLSPDGAEFLSYARQVTEQAALLEQRYLHTKPRRRLCAISTQHYSFAVDAFVALLQTIDAEAYEFTLRETRTHEIIEDVRTLRSEVGVLYLNEFNGQVLGKLLKESELKFHPLFTAKPHVFLSSRHPLAGAAQVTPEALLPYPFLSFEQGENNSFYFSEELLSTLSRPKNIRVSDRATLFNLLIGLNGYTICSGLLSSALNGDNIVSVPLVTDETMEVGWIENTRAALSPMAERYVKELQRILAEEAPPAKNA